MKGEREEEARDERRKRGGKREARKRKGEQRRINSINERKKKKREEKENKKQENKKKDQNKYERGRRRRRRKAVEEIIQKDGRDSYGFKKRPSGGAERAQSGIMAGRDRSCKSLVLIFERRNSASFERGLLARRAARSIFARGGRGECGCLGLNDLRKGFPAIELFVWLFVCTWLSLARIK